MTTWVFVLMLMVGDEPAEVKVRVAGEEACRAFQETAVKVIQFTPVDLLGVVECKPEVGV